MEKIKHSYTTIYNGNATNDSKNSLKVFKTCTKTYTPITKYLHKGIESMDPHQEYECTEIYL